MNNAPCKNCDRRGCGSYHDICEVYQEWKREDDLIKDARHHEHMLLSDRNIRVNHMMSSIRHGKINKTNKWFS